MASETCRTPDKAECHDCGRPYGDEHGFPDLVVSHDAWAKISPTGDEGGLLCPSCMTKRAHDAGVTATARFTSGPFRSLTEREAEALNTILSCFMPLPDPPFDYETVPARVPADSYNIVWNILRRYRGESEIPIDEEGGS